MYKKSIKEEVNMKKGEQFPEWALWKALITYDANKDSNEKIAEESYRVIQVMVDDYER